MMLGFRTKIQDNLIESTGHINISVRNDYFTVKSLVGVFFRENRPENDPRVISYSPMISRSVIIQNGFAAVNVTLHGIDPDMHGSAVSGLDEITSGQVLLLGEDIHAISLFSF